ncbi:Cnd1 domain-containing protein, partial [Cephalotus follicularis]
MEHQVTSTCPESLNLSPDNPLSPQTLASFRSLIINPNTPDSTLSSLLETLTRSLKLTRDSLAPHHALKLLTDLAIHHPHFSTLVFHSVRSFSLSTVSTRLATEALDSLVSIADHNKELITAFNELGDQFFVSLCFGPSLSARSWILRNADRFGVRPSLLLTVFLGFTEDPYPHVRRDALYGLVCLCRSSDARVIEDSEVIEGCYRRAVELLCDHEDYVRRAAVCVVSEWGKMLVDFTQEESKVCLSNAVFIQLCSMVRDMNMEVRLEAFDALKKIGMVSESVLLQTLSKKVLATTKEKKSHGQRTAECFEISSSNAAGAFVHGLEDEFHEVRMSACIALRTLTILSAKFAGEALNLLMDMLNDESVVVRLQALETMHHMATCKCLKVQGIHMHRFLGSLFDNNAFIRSTSRKILKLLNLPDLKFFKLSVDSLLENLATYPEDEADIFSVLFYIGQIHGNFAACIIKEVFQEIEPDTEGKLSFDGARVAAFLVIAISVPLSHKQSFHCIPPTVFSYAVTFLGRISHALSDVMNQNTLLAYLTWCSRSPSSCSDFKGEEPFSPVVKGDVPNLSSTEISNPIRIPLQQTCDDSSDVQSQTWQKLKEIATLRSEFQRKEHDEVLKPLDLMLIKIKDIWPLVQSGCTSEVLRTLRVCKEEVETFTGDSLGSAGASAFVLQYLRVMKLLAKVWVHFVPNVKYWFYEVGELEFLSGKLEKRLREMRCRFLGLSTEENLHVLELILMTCLLKLSRVENCCYLTTMKNLSATVSLVKSLCEGGSVEPSNFVIEVSKTLNEIGTCTGGTYCRPFFFKMLIDFFSPGQFVLCRRLRHVKAELEAPGNSSENPLSFIPGLPVAIQLNITLHNISSENRLWLRITVGKESTQFVFLDLKVVGGCSEVRTFTFNAPFYKTPKAVSFTLRVCIGMECLFEDIQLVKGCGGPKHVLVYLCQEKDIYL